jgi:hypothetical protein
MTSDNPQPPKKNEAPDAHPGLGLWGWLGRQIGHIRQAVKTDVTAPSPKTIYRDTKIEEQPMPDDPRVKLRRTIIDEVVVDPKKPNEPNQQ